MKMKKLLAGVLSATMVATMIPAGMALGVSAEEDSGNGLVAYYDFTKSQTDGWTDVTGVTVSDDSVSTTYDTDGVYSIDNPLQGKVTDGFTVVVTTSAGFNNPYTSLFSFSVLSSPRTSGVAVSGAFSVMSDYTSMHLNPWDGGYNGYWDYHVDSEVVEDTGTTFVLTGNSNGGVTLYKNGEVVVTFASTDEILSAATSSGGEDYVKTVAYWVNAMEYFNLGTSSYWTSETKTYTSVAFYNVEMSEDEVTALSIANALDLEVIGMQKGTVNGSNAIRFAANVNADAVDFYNDGTIVSFGWASEQASAFSNYKTTRMTTVTSNSELAGEGTYAYTIMFTDSENYYSVAPYAVIEVNGESYTFVYNGKGASYVSDASGLVYAPVNFAEVEETGA